MRLYWASATICILSYVCSVEASLIARLLDEDRADSGEDLILSRDKT